MRKLCMLLPLLGILFLVSCSKKDEDATQGKYPYYFSATINGKLVKYEANDLDSKYDNTASESSSALVGVHYDIYEGTWFMYGRDLLHNQAEVYILKYFTDEPTDAQLNAMFYKGNYGYGKGEQNATTINGAVIQYTDEQGVSWSTEAGSQAGSTFTITELIDNPDGTSKKIFKASFSCKLYDEEGHSIQVTNGEVRGRIL